MDVLINVASCLFLSWLVVGFAFYAGDRAARKDEALEPEINAQDVQEDAWKAAEDISLAYAPKAASKTPTLVIEVDSLDLLSGLGIRELRQHAKALKIPKYGSMTKNQLIAALR